MLLTPENTGHVGVGYGPCECGLPVGVGYPCYYKCNDTTLSNTHKI